MVEVTTTVPGNAPVERRVSSEYATVGVGDEESVLIRQDLGDRPDLLVPGREHREPQWAADADRTG